MSHNELGIIIAAVGVVIGVFLEGWEHLDDFKKKGWKPVIPKLGFGILVISLAVEILFDARLAQESANTELKAALLQKAVSWRQLTGPQQRAIAKALGKFTNEQINVLAYDRDVEAWGFADLIEVALGSLPERAPWNAHWDVHFGHIVTSPRLTSGMIVEVAPTANRHDWDAAKALADNLRAIQPGAVLGPMDRPKELAGETVRGNLAPHAPITLTVGVHPPPPSALQGQ